MTSPRAGLMHVDVEAGHLAVEVAGDGAPVVLVHGVPGSRRLWDDVVDGLVAEGFQTLAAGLLGVGDSSRPTGIDRLRIEAQAAAVTTLLGQVGPAILVGHDYGCPISVISRPTTLTCCRVSCCRQGTCSPTRPGRSPAR
jgi:pimeloyl-ACP methyl ester carboxylesterase